MIRLGAASKSGYPPRTAAAYLYSEADACEKALSEAIHECLQEILGCGVRQAIYEFMERRHSVPRNELTKHVEELFSVFQQNFGVKATDVIARAFAKKLCAKLDIEFHPVPKLEFVDYLAIIRRKITLGERTTQREKRAKTL